MFNSQLSRNAQNKARFSSRPTAENDGEPVVLIVEDDADSRFMLRYMLEMWKYKVIEAKNGTEAIIAAESFCPDLILMDVSLPDTDGFAVTRRLRRSRDLDGVPVVFLSGHSRNSFGDETSGVEITDYFVKPIGADDLKETVGKYCRAARKAA